MLDLNFMASNLTTGMPVICPRFLLKFWNFGGLNTGIPVVEILAIKLLLDVGFYLCLRVVSMFFLWSNGAFTFENPTFSVTAPRKHLGPSPCWHYVSSGCSDFSQNQSLVK